MIIQDRSSVRLSLLLASCLLLLTSYLAPTPVLAHKVQMFAHAERDRVFVEGYFPDGKKTINSEVIVFNNKSGEELLRGKTDDAGKFSFKVPKKTDLRIALNASLGHKTEYVLPESDLGGMEEGKSHGIATAAATEENKRGADKKGDIVKGEVREVAGISQTDPTEIAAMIEKEVEKGVSPLMRSFSECKEHVFFSEIIGGIGYIFGVLGIVFYFKAKKIQK